MKTIKFGIEKSTYCDNAWLSAPALRAVLLTVSKAVAPLFRATAFVLSVQLSQATITSSTCLKRLSTVAPINAPSLWAGTTATTRIFSSPAMPDYFQSSSSTSLTVNIRTTAIAASIAKNNTNADSTLTNCWNSTHTPAPATVADLKQCPKYIPTVPSCNSIYFPLIRKTYCQYGFVF